MSAEDLPELPIPKHVEVTKEFIDIDGWLFPLSYVSKSLLVWLQVSFIRWVKEDGSARTDSGSKASRKRFRMESPGNSNCQTRGDFVESFYPMIPQHYPIEPGTLFGGEYPGDRKPEVALARLFILVEIGIRTFIDLTTRADGLAPYETLLPELELESGASLRRIAMPIPDMGVPESEESMRSIVDVIRESIAASPAVYIHCWGGIGRTGTVVGCWLRECGHDPESALQRVQHLYSSHMPKAKSGRYPEAPQTPEQKNYIRRWNAGR